jgi:ABC-2 type transport system permease protein
MTAGTTPASARGHVDVAAGAGAPVALERVHERGAWWRGSGSSVREIWRYRELLAQLVRKELKVRYKDSALGFLWTLVRPLLQLLVYSIAIGIFLGSSKAIPSFGIFLFTGLLAWTLFTDILGGATASIVGNAGLVKKVYFPRELFPLAVVGAAVINTALQSVVLIGAFGVTGHWPDPANLPLVPLALLVLVVFATALGLLLAAANVYLRDVQYLVEVGTLLWFWMTPIIYDWTKVRDQLAERHGWAYQLYIDNPMATVVLSVQHALWRQGAGTVFDYTGDLYTRLGVTLGACVVFLWFAQRIFIRAQGNFAQEL